MGNKQNYKCNINYFKKSDTVKYLGIALAAIGLLLYFLGWGYVTYIIASVALPVGGVLFIVGSSGKSSDSDIDEFITKQTEDLVPEMISDPKVQKKMLKQIPPEIAEGYVFSSDAMVAKAKDGSIRSSEYTKAIIYPFEDRLYIVTRSFSLVSDNIINTDTEITYADIKKIGVVHENKRIVFLKKSFSLDLSFLVIETNDGETYSLPTHENAGTDSFIEKICRVAGI